LANNVLLQSNRSVVAFGPVDRPSGWHKSRLLLSFRLSFQSPERQPERRK